MLFIHNILKSFQPFRIFFDFTVFYSLIHALLKKSFIITKSSPPQSDGLLYSIRPLHFK